MSGRCCSVRREKCRCTFPSNRSIAVFGQPKDPDLKEITLKVKVYPAYFEFLAKEGETVSEQIKTT